MTEAEGHIFVTRPIVKAKETAGAGEGNHCMRNTHAYTHARTHKHIHCTLVTPIRLSDKDDAFFFSTGVLRHTHTLQADSYNYSDRNWQVALSVPYCSLWTSKRQKVTVRLNAHTRLMTLSDSNKECVFICIMYLCMCVFNLVSSKSK